MSLICPYTNSCILYKNWVKKTGDERINIIYEGSKFSCIALDSLKDPSFEGGIPASQELVKKIHGLESTESYLPENIECSHITLLNLLVNKR
jgi:hypothetical protein